MEKLSDAYIFSWSCNQSAGHIETFGDYIKNNIQTILKNNESDYVMVGIATTKEEINMIANDFYKLKQEWRNE